VGTRDAAALSRRLRELPSVGRLAAALGDGASPEAEEAMTMVVARRVIDERRDELRADPHAPPVDLVAHAQEALARGQRRSLRRVVNATGVILHTNLGRAPLAPSAQAAVAEVAAGYCNLELDLRGGGRGSRHDHVEALLCELTGAEAALTVNNGAAATLLAAATLAGPGRSVVVSRGQLIEIGGSFRIPEVIAASGSELIEVGTTNRTRLEDYAVAIAEAEPRVGALLRVHPSNFATFGFVASVEVAQLCGLGPPVIDDVGSGVLVDGVGELEAEPAVRGSVSAGSALVCFSGDKLLGGPQAGLLVGRADAVARARAHPLARALRIDKLSLAALEATLALYREPARALAEIPVLAMLAADPEVLARRARDLAGALGDRGEVVASSARVGGGALPVAELAGPAVAVDAGSGGADALAAALRGADPPVIGHIHDGRLLLDPRTMTDADAEIAASSLIGLLTP